LKYKFQVKDARAALDALREEEKERKRREAEEAERLRQIQMREKLEVMRQKKQEYLQYQRQVHIFDLILSFYVIHFECNQINMKYVEAFYYCCHDI
jgi:hypothetical protein